MTTRPKQANNRILKIENYLLARMQCKGQDYMMLKDTTCKTTKKLILPLQMSPCGIMDLSLASYKFSPLRRLIHNPLSSLSRTIKLMLAFGPLNSPPLELNTKTEDIISTREGQLL